MPTAPPDSKAFSAALLRWYDVVRRPLPWRGSRDAYRIWISEVMLQQTTVATVTPRWERFLRRWPTLADLAAAPIDDVLHEWSGLGYYARARNLHKAARTVADQHGAALPGNFTALRALPGFGDYTAAAVASIAFDEPVPVLDANVERVLTRVLAFGDNPRTTAGKALLRRVAGELLDPARPGDANQAIMELGATLCTPKAPRCGECPVASHCRARAEGRPESYPRLAPKPKFEEVAEVAIVLRRGDAVLLLQRAPDVSFGGMWELPRVVATEEESLEEAAERAALELGGLTAHAGAELLEIRHTVMRRRIDLHVFTGHESGAGEPTAPLPEGFVQRRWVPVGEWMDLPKSTTQTKIAKKLL